ncbi:unnamed protein product [Aphanomyces euteiches]
MRVLIPLFLAAAALAYEHPSEPINTDATRALLAMRRGRGGSRGGSRCGSSGTGAALGQAAGTIVVPSTRMSKTK